VAEMFLKIDGINGESIDKDHGQEIEILSWSWLTKNPIRWDLNQGGQSTKVDIDKITVNKACDQASVALYQYCLTGKHFKNARIICRKNDGLEKIEYLTVLMEDVMISKVTWAGQGEAQFVTETVDISFAEFRILYKTQRDSGSADGDMHFGYNVQTQVQT
jgi:type VI secretion system secreted protein Hcp